MSDEPQESETPDGKPAEITVHCPYCKAPQQVSLDDEISAGAGLIPLGCNNCGMEFDYSEADGTSREKVAQTSSDRGQPDPGETEVGHRPVGAADGASSETATATADARQAAVRQDAGHRSIVTKQSPPGIFVRSGAPSPDAAHDPGGKKPAAEARRTDIGKTINAIHALVQPLQQQIETLNLELRDVVGQVEGKVDLAMGDLGALGSLTEAADKSQNLLTESREKLTQLTGLSSEIKAALDSTLATLSDRLQKVTDSNSRLAEDFDKLTEYYKKMPAAMRKSLENWEATKIATERHADALERLTATDRERNETLKLMNDERNRELQKQNAERKAELIGDRDVILQSLVPIQTFLRDAGEKMLGPLEQTRLEVLQAQQQTREELQQAQQQTREELKESQRQAGEQFQREMAGLRQAYEKIAASTEPQGIANVVAAYFEHLTSQVDDRTKAVFVEQLPMLLQAVEKELAFWRLKLASDCPEPLELTWDGKRVKGESAAGERVPRQAVELAIRVVIDALLSVQKKIDIFSERMGLVPFPKEREPAIAARIDERWEVHTDRSEDNGLIKQVVYKGYELPGTVKPLCKAGVEVWKYKKP